MVLNMMSEAKIPAMGNLLDIGCGTGHWTIFFKGIGYLPEGIDLSSKMLELARLKEPSLNFIEGDALNLPQDEGTFDIVSMITVLEFASDPDRLLQESYRVLRKGGALIIGSLNRISGLGESLSRNPFPPYDRAYLFSLEELEEKLSSAGFEVINIKEGCIPGNPDPIVQHGDFLAAIGVKK
jgi:ubiquinone/menaquinone biosynthesis C-methylase UbiE